MIVLYLGLLNKKWTNTFTKILTQENHCSFSEKTQTETIWIIGRLKAHHGTYGGTYWDGKKKQMSQGMPAILLIGSPMPDTVLYNEWLWREVAWSRLGSALKGNQSSVCRRESFPPVSSGVASRQLFESWAPKVLSLGWVLILLNWKNKSV